MNRLDTPIPSNKQQPHFYSNEAEGSKFVSSSLQAALDESKRILGLVLLLIGLVYFTPQVFGYSEAEKIDELFQYPAYRIHAGGRPYLVGDYYSEEENVKIRPGYTVQSLLEGIDRGQAHQGGPGVSGFYSFAGDNERISSNCIEAIDTEDRGTQGWVNAEIWLPFCYDILYIKNGHRIVFGRCGLDFEFNFGSTAPRANELRLLNLDTNDCGESHWAQCPDHRVYPHEVLSGFELNVEDLHLYESPKDGESSFNRRRLILFLPRLYDEDFNLQQAFFHYKQETDSAVGAWRPFRPDWGHHLSFEKEGWGHVYPAVAKAWVEIMPNVLDEFKRGGVFHFYGRVEDSDGHKSSPSNTVTIQIWGPPEPRSLYVNKDTLYEGQAYTLYADAFHPNGIETRANIYLEGEGIDGRKQLNGEELTAHGYQVTFSHSLPPQNPGNYRIILELTDEHDRKATEDLVLDITCHPKVVIRGLLKDRLILETGYDFQDRPSDAERADLESKLDEDIACYNHLINRYDNEEGADLTAIARDRVETSWRILETLKELGRGGEEFQKRENEHYYSFATYYFNLTVSAKNDYESARTAKEKGVQLARWYRLSTMALGAQNKVPSAAGWAYPDISLLHNISVVTWEKVSPLVRAYALIEDGRLLHENGDEALGNERIREGGTILLPLLKRSAEKIRTALDQPNLSDYNRYNYYLLAIKLAGEFKLISNGASIDNAACEYIRTLIKEAEQGERELVNSGKVKSADGRSYASISVEKTGDNAFTVTASDKSAFLSKTFTTNGNHFTEDGESLNSTLLHNAHEIDFNIGNLDFTLDAEGYLTLNAIESGSGNVVLEVSIPGTLKLGSGVTSLKSLTFSGHAFIGADSLITEALTINSASAELYKLLTPENVDTLTIEAAAHTHLSIDGAQVPSLNISNGASLHTSGGFRIGETLTLNVTEWTNAADINASNLSASVAEFSQSEGASIDTEKLNIITTNFSNAGTLIGRESQSIRAKNFYNEAPSQIASKNLSITGFSEAMNAGMIGASLPNADGTTELSSNVVLEGTNLTNTGNIQGSHTTLDIATAEGVLKNQEIIHADHTLTIKGDATFFNEGKIDSGGTINLQIANMLNTGMIAANGGIRGSSNSSSAWTNGDSGTLSAGDCIDLILESGLVNEGESGEIMARDIHFSMPKFTNRKECTVANKAELSLREFVQDNSAAKFKVGNDSDEGVLEFISSLNTYTNEGTVEINGSVEGSNVQPLITDPNTHTWGEIEGVFKGNWEITDTMHLFGDGMNIHVAGDLIIKEGATLTCAGQVNGEGYTAGEVTITVGGNFINKGTFTGGKNTRVNVSSTLENHGTIDSHGDLFLACSDFLKDKDADIKSAGILDIQTERISKTLSGKISSVEGALSIVSKGSIFIDDATISFGHGGLLESSGGGISLKENTRIQSTSFEHDLKMYAPNGVFKNEASWVLVFGDLLVEARDIINTRKRVGDMVETGKPPNEGGYHYKHTLQVGKSAEFYVQGSLHFLAKEVIRNHGGLISTVGDLHFTGTHIDNQDQILRGEWRTWHEGRKRGGVSKLTHSDGPSYWEPSEKHSAIVGACIVGGSAYIHVRGDFEEEIVFSTHNENLKSWNPHFINSGHFQVEHDLNVTTDEGRERIVKIYSKMDPAVDKALVLAGTLPQSGLVIDVSMDTEALLARYPIERAVGEESKKFVYVSTIQYEPEAYAKAIGVSIEDLTAYPNDAAYILPEGMSAEEFEKIPYLFDPVSFGMILDSHYGLMRSFIKDMFVQEGIPVPQSVLSGDAQMSGLLMNKLALENGAKYLRGELPGSEEGLLALASGLGFTAGAEAENSNELVLRGSGHSGAFADLVAQCGGSQNKALTAYLDNNSSIFGPHTVAFVLLVEQPDGTLAKMPWNNFNPRISDTFDENLLGEGTINVRENLSITGDNVEFYTNSFIVAGKTLKLEVGSVDVEAPVIEYDITVEENKGMLGGTRTKTFTIREVQPGGVIKAMDIVVESEKDIVSIGGHIIADNNIDLTSKTGNIVVKAQNGSELVSWDAGTLGKLLGKAEHALKTTYSPSEIKAGGVITITAEELDILIEASTVLGEEGTKLIAEGDITVEGKTTKTRVEDSASNHGLGTKSKMREEVDHYDAVVGSTRGDLLIMAGGTFRASGATLVGAKGIVIDAEEGVDIEAITQDYESSDGASGFDTFGYSSSETHRTHMAIFPTRILSGGDLTITSGKDILLSATNLNAVGDVTIEAGGNLTIQGEELIEESTTKGRSLCASFFGSQAFQDIVDDRSTEQIIDDFIREDPLGAALIGLKGVNDAQDGIAQALQIAVQLYNLQKSFDKVGDILDNGMPVTDLGVLGQRLGLTDASGNFSPRITVRLGWSKSHSKLVSIVGTQIKGENVYLIAHNNLKLKDGTQVEAEDTLSLEADGDIIMEPGVQEQLNSSSGRGVSVSHGSGLTMSVGLDGNEANSQIKTHLHNHLTAGRRIILRSSGGQLIQGTVVEAPEIDVRAKRFIVESVLDTSESHAWSASLNSSGAVSGFRAESDSAWVTTVSGLYASESLNVTIEGDLEIIGAVLDGPEEATFIDAETIHYTNLDEHSHEESLGLAFTFVVDPKSLIYGDGIPVTIEYESTQIDQEGTTHATVAGTDRDGNDPLNIHDWENSDDLEGLNRDRDNIQTRGPVVKKHVHVYVPVPRFVLKGIGNLWSSVTEDVSPSDNEDLRKIAAIHEVLKSAEGDAGVDTSDAAPENILGYDVVEDNSSLPEEDRSELSAVRIENEATGSEVKMTLIGLDADQQFIESFFSNEDMALGAMERVNEDGSTQGTIVAQNEAGDEIVLNVNAAAIDQIAGGKTLAEVSPEELKTYISDLLEYQKGVGRGLWIDGPIKATKETWALAKGVARKTWEGLRDPVKADMELYRWVLEGYVKASSQWALAKKDPVAYFTEAGQTAALAWNNYIAELKNNGEFAGESGFSLAMAFVPIPVEGIQFMKNAVNIVDDVTDLAHFGKEVSTVKEFESLVSDLSRMGKGELGESAARRTMERVGYQEIPSKLPGGQGFDGIFVKYGSDGGIDHLIITESKFSKSGKGRLSTPGKGKQMGDDWINATIEQMRNCNVPEIQDVGYFLKINSHLIERKINVLDGAGANRWNTLKPPPTEKFN